MTENECRKVSTHLIDAFPNGPKAYIWREALIELDYGPAVGAFKALIKESEKAPTVARFLGHYNNLTRRDEPVAGVRWNGDEISFDQYLSHVTRRANQGNPEAAEELARWTRWLTRKQPT